MSSRRYETSRSRPELPQARGARARALARARRLPRVDPPPRGRRRRSSSTRARRRPTAGRARTTSSRASSRTSSRATRRCAATSCTARAAGTATACRSSSRSSASSASSRRTTSRSTASPSSTRKCRESVFTYIDEWSRLTERIGFWIDTDQAYYDADQRLHRVGLVVAQGDLEEGPAVRGPQGRALLPALRHGAVLARGRAGLQGRRRPVGVRALPAARRGRRVAARLDDDAVDAHLERGAGGRRRHHLRARARGRRGADPGRGAGRRGAGRGRATRSSRACPGSRAGRHARTSRRSRTSPTTGRAATPSCAADFVTTEDGTGIVHTAVAFGEDDFRLGEEYGLTRAEPGQARRHLRRAHRAVGRHVGQGRRPGDRRGAARVRPPVPRRGLRARLPALLALRHAAPLLRQAVLVHPHDRRCATQMLAEQREDQLVPGAHQARALRQVAREQRRLGAVARALLGHAAADLALRRQGTSTRSGRSTELRELARRRARGPAQAVHRRGHVPVRRVRRDDAPRARGDRRLVRLGSMPFAQWHAPFENQDAVRGALPGGLHLRGARPDARLVLLAARRVDAAVRQVVVRDRASASA